MKAEVNILKIKRNRIVKLMEIHLINTMIIFLTYISISLSGSSIIYGIIGASLLILSTLILWITRGKLQKAYSFIVSFGLGMFLTVFQSADVPKDGSIIMFFLGLIFFLILLEGGTLLYKTTHKHAWYQLLFITYLVMAIYILTALNDNFILFFIVTGYMTFNQIHFASYFHHQRVQPHDYMNKIFYIPLSIFIFFLMLSQIGSMQGNPLDLFYERFVPKQKKQS
jgi:hypothetical protein